MLAFFFWHLPTIHYYINIGEINLRLIFMSKVMYIENGNPLVCWTCMWQLKENVSHDKTPLARTQATLSSKVSSSDSVLERPPMIEISNKLHAMVDAFVSNMSSECDSLANNISTQAHMYAALDSVSEAARAPRPSNRTTTEVLNGLIRPSGDHSTDPNHREGKSRIENGTLDLQEGKTRNREGGRFVRRGGDKKPKSSTLERTDNHNDVTSVEPSSENTLSKDEAEPGRGAHDTASIGKFMQTIEILSSDQSSDDSLRTNMKNSRKMVGKQKITKIRKSSSQGRPTELDMRSPSRSPESSHLMDYSYEEDTPSLGGRSPPIESTFMKLRWPKDVETIHEGGIERNNENNNVHGMNESSKKNGKKASVDDVRLHEGDESNEEDAEGNENEETDDEELPVLPKAPVKRKLMSEPKSAERSTQRGRPKSGNPQTKKQRTPQIDASVITQLEFGKRPENCVSITTPPLCVSMQLFLDVSHTLRCIHEFINAVIVINLCLFYLSGRIQSG